MQLNYRLIFPVIVLLIGISFALFSCSKEEDDTTVPKKIVPEEDVWDEFFVEEFDQNGSWEFDTVLAEYFPIGDTADIVKKPIGDKRLWFVEGGMMHLNSWELVDAWKLRGSQATLYLDSFIPSERYKVTLGVHRYQQYFEYSSSGPGSHSSQSSSGGTTIHFVLNGMSYDLSAWSPPDQRDCGGGDSRVIEFELNKNDGLVALNGSKENQPIPCFSGMEKTMFKNQIVFTSMALESAYSSAESRSALIEPNEFIIDFIKIASIDSLR